MRIVGKEVLPPATNEPTVANLVAADRFMAGLRRLCGGRRHFFPKGVHRYRTHEEADAALLDAVARDIDPAWFEEGNTIRVADEFVVDVMFDACGESYESLRPFARATRFEDGTEIRTLDLEGLLRTKQTVHGKDEEDRVFIETALRLWRERHD